MVNAFFYFVKGQISFGGKNFLNFTKYELAVNISTILSVALPNQWECVWVCVCRSFGHLRLAHPYPKHTLSFNRKPHPH